MGAEEQGVGGVRLARVGRIGSRHLDESKVRWELSPSADRAAHAPCGAPLIARRSRVRWIRASTPSSTASSPDTLTRRAPVRCGARMLEPRSRIVHAWPQVWWCDGWYYAAMTLCLYIILPIGESPSTASPARSPADLTCACRSSARARHHALLDGLGVERASMRLGDSFGVSGAPPARLPRRVPARSRVSLRRPKAGQALPSPALSIRARRLAANG